MGTDYSGGGGGGGGAGGVSVPTQEEKKTFPVWRYFTSKSEFVSNIFSMIVSGNIVLLLTHLRPLQT